MTVQIERKRFFWSSFCCLALIAALLISASVSFPSCASPGKKEASAPESGLHRADFKVEGASCVVCLRRVAKKLKGVAGVVKADVSIFRPYWALVVYDSKKTSLQKVFEAAGDEKVKFSEVEDVPLAEMPLVLLPRSVSISDK